MEAKLPTAAPPEAIPGKPEFPYSNWGPLAAVCGVLMALIAGIFLGLPAIILGDQHGGVLVYEAPAYSESALLGETNTVAVAVDPTDNLVLGAQGDEVAAFDSDGAELPQSPFEGFGDATGVAVGGNGEIYVSDSDGGTIFGFHRRALDDPFRFAAGGEEFEPEALATDRLARPNLVYAVDRGGDAVSRFSEGGGTRGRIEASDSPAGSFGFDDSDLNGIAVDSTRGPGAGTVFVVAADEDDEGTVWAFTRAGDFLWELPSSAEGNPCGLAVDAGGRLWIADAEGGATMYARGAGTDEAPTPTGRTAADGEEKICDFAFSGDGTLYAASDPPQLTTTASIVLQLGGALGFLLIPFVISGTRGNTFRRSLRRLGVRGFRPSAIGWIFAAIGAYLVFAALYVAVFGEPEQEDIAESFGPLPFQLLLIVIAAPIAEEICFRGMLFGGLRERWPMLVAALLSGLIFGALHALTGLSAVPPLIFFGFVLALLYEKTGSILPPIILHMLNNSVALLGQ